MNRLTNENLDPIPDRQFNPWNFRPDAAAELGGVRLAGCKAEAVDGNVGTVVDASTNPDDSYLVVNVGWWVFGTRVQVPAGTVNHIDNQERRIYLDRSRDQVKAAPQVPAEAYDDPGHREQLADYYRGTYR